MYNHKLWDIWVTLRWIKELFGLGCMDTPTRVLHETTHQHKANSEKIYTNLHDMAKDVTSNMASNTIQLEFRIICAF